MGRGDGGGRTARLLVVDDDRAFLVSLEALLEDEGGYRVETAGSGAEALDVVRAPGRVDLVVSDLSMPGMDGLELLRAVRDESPEMPFIVMTAHGSVATAVEAMRLGAFQYLTKPVDPDELLVQVQGALQVAAVRADRDRLAARLGDPDRHDVMVGTSPAMRELARAVDGVAAVDSTVLLRGETGTGKELVARLIHRRGPRAARPFVVVNCTAIPRDLLESELFGHQKGAFTGAVGSRRGRIEEAEGGALLLDEVGDMPPELQPKLLRFLQERTVRRLGADRERRVDLRVMAATHRDLERAIAEGGFREDLFYRLNTIPVRLPPLRERLDDLPELCDHLVAKIAERLGRPPAPVGDAVLGALAGHAFPGNVRELENLLERALVLGAAAGSPGVGLEPRHLGLDAARGGEAAPRVPLEGGFEQLRRLHAAAEEALVRRALAAWPELSNREIAERLGTNRRVLELRMKEYGVDKGAPV